MDGVLLGEIISQGLQPVKSKQYLWISRPTEAMICGLDACGTPHRTHVKLLCISLGMLMGSQQKGLTSEVGSLRYCSYRECISNSDANENKSKNAHSEQRDRQSRRAKSTS